MEIEDRTNEQPPPEPAAILEPVQSNLPLEGAQSEDTRPIVVSADSVEPIRRTKKRGRPKKSERAQGEPIVAGVVDTPPETPEPTQNQSSVGTELLTARALVETLGAVCAHWLPPSLTDPEKDVLTAAWAPVIRQYQDQWFASPWAVALVATSGIMLPRLAEKYRVKEATKPV